MILSMFFVSYLDFSSTDKSRVYYKRAPASASDLERDIDKVYSEVSNPTFFNRSNCESYISEVTDFLLTKGSQTYLPQSKEEYNLLVQRSHQIVEKIFFLRLKLHERITEMSAKENLGKACVIQSRKAFRYARFLEEFITEIAVSKSEQKSTQVFDERDFSEAKYQLHINPKYDNIEFKTGDIFLVRATSFVSETIARVGDEDGQFSHVAIIYVDNGVPYVMESLIESGVGIKKLDDWRKNGHHVRNILFRMKDQKLAAEAAENLYHVIKERKANKVPIPYDFKMKSDEHTEIFCAEILQWALDMVTDGHSPIPRYKTEFHKFANHRFLEGLTVKETSTFSPNDLEVDPNVEIVAEWRNYKGTRLRRVQDVVLTAMMSWMVDKNYILKGSLRSVAMTNIAWVARKLFGFKKDQIPPNMPYGFLKTFIKLEKVSMILENYLSDLEQEYFEKTGYSMDYATMLAEMEKLRVKDCQTYIQRENEWEESIQEGSFSPTSSPRPLFHRIFNTKNGMNCAK